MNIRQATLNYIIGIIVGLGIAIALDDTEQRILDTCKMYAKVEVAGVTLVCATQTDIMAKYKGASHV